MATQKRLAVEECIRKITIRMRRAETGKSPVSITLINVNNSEDLKKIHYRFIGDVNYHNVSSLAQNDSVPRTEDILELLLSNKNSTLFLEGISAYAGFIGNEYLEKLLEQILGLPFSSSATNFILLYQCEDLLRELYKKDRRTERNFFLVEGKSSPRPAVIFVSMVSPVMLSHKPYDFKELCDHIEYMDSDRYFVSSHFSKKDFPNSNYILSDITSYFDMFCSFTALKLMDIDRELLTEERWRDFAIACFGNGGPEKYFSKNFGTVQSLDESFLAWKQYSDGKRILLFIYARTHPEMIRKEYLRYALSKCRVYDQFTDCLYASILDFNSDQIINWERYNERKELLLSVGVTEDVAAVFCNLAVGDTIHSISVLTDLTKVERKQIVSLLAKYGSNFSRDEISVILKHVYRDLYEYLQPFDYGVEKLNLYFNEYKWLKVENFVSEDFQTFVEREAKERSYFKFLPIRNEKFEKLKTNGAIVYFLDALGVEYMSYIYAKAADMGMYVVTEYCRAELPSITEFNGGFVKFFKDKGIEVREDVKGLDHIKHNGTLEYDFQKNPDAPTYLVDEFFEIDEALARINDKVGVEYERAYIISDHGATRLAIVGYTGKRWEFTEKGSHGGRCCKVSAEDHEIPVCITRENDYWVVANYDSIKGGRMADYEVHGGATLEELCVPIIEFTRRPKEIQVNIVTKEVVFNKIRKETPVLRFSLGVSFEDLKVRIDGKYYGAVSEGGTKYSVILDTSLKMGEKVFAIFSNGNLIKDGLKFTLRTKTMKNENMFN